MSHSTGSISFLTESEHNEMQLRTKFDELVATWEVEAGPETSAYIDSSGYFEASKAPSFGKLIKMGPAILPLIDEKIKTQKKGDIIMSQSWGHLAERIQAEFDEKMNKNLDSAKKNARITLAIAAIVALITAGIASKKCQPENMDQPRLEDLKK